MTFTLGLAQCRHPDNGDAADLVARYAERAVRAGVEVLVFPESLMSPYEMDAAAFVNASQPLDGAFTRAVDAIAAQAGLWLVYTMNEKHPHGGKPYNTAIVTDGNGARRGIYRKVHLFDAQSYRESQRMAPGNALFEPLETPFCTLGLGICYDLRFPEAARAAALAGCELLLYPAAWVAGPRKLEQWETLLSARAIENECFVAGVCRCDAAYIGNSRVFGPDGALLASAESEEALVTCRIDTGEIARVRKTTPVFDHRRQDLYP